MDQGWRRFHLLLVVLTLWKHAIGYPSWNSPVNPRSLRYHKAFSPRGSKSLSNAWVTKNIPVDVNFNVLAVESPNSYQFGSGSGTYESVSQTPSSLSGSVSASLVSSQHAPGSPAYAKLLSSPGRFTSYATNRQGSRSQLTSTSQDRSRSKLTQSSSQFVSSPGGSASLGGLSSQPMNTSSEYSPVSSAYPSLGYSSMAVSGPSSVKTSQLSLSSETRAGSGRLATSHLSGLAQDVSSHPVGLYGQSQGSPSRLAFGSSLSASKSMAGAETTSNQHKQTTEQSLSWNQIPQRWQPSATSSSQGSQTSEAMSQSRFSVLSAPVPSKSLASGGHLGPNAPASLYSSASMPSPQSGSSIHSQAAGSAHSSSQSQAPQRWQPSASLSSKGFQTSSSTVSQGSSSSQSAKFPNRFSLVSGSGPSHPVSTQGSSNYSSLTLSLGSSAQYAPAFSKPASPLGDQSLFTSSKSHHASKSQSMSVGIGSASSRYPSAKSEVGSNIASLQPLVAAGHYAPPPALDVKVPVYSHANSSGSSSLQSPTWQPTTSGRLSSRLSFSGAALTQTSSSLQNVQSPSRFSSVQGSVGPYTRGSSIYDKFGTSSLGVSSQSSSGQSSSSQSSSGQSSSSQSSSGQSSSSQYSPISTPGSSGELTYSSGYPYVLGESGSAHYAPAHSKPDSPLGDPSLFTSSQSHYASKSKSMAGGTVGASVRYVSAPREVGSYIASLQPQVAAGHLASAPSLDFKVPVYSHATSSGSSMSSNLQSQTWQPTTSGRLSSRFPSSVAALTQTNSSPQNVQSSTGPSQSSGSVGLYTPVSPAYDKFGTSSLGVSSQSSSGHSSSSQYSPISTTGASGELTYSSGYPYALGESGSAHYAPAHSKPASPLGDPSLFTSSQGHYASKSQSMSVGIGSASSRYPSAQRGDGSNVASFQLQVAGGQYAPVPSLDVKVPVYSHATTGGSSSIQSQTWQPTTSGSFYSKLGLGKFSTPSFQSSRHPTGSTTQSSDSNIQGASKGVSSASSEAETLSDYSDDIGKVWWSV